MEKYILVSSEDEKTIRLMKNGKPFLINGVHKIVDDNNTTICYDAEGGYVRQYKLEMRKELQKEVWTFVDEFRNQVINAYGFLKIEFSFDENGNQVKQESFGKNGLPKNNRFGISAYCYEYKGKSLLRSYSINQNGKIEEL